MKYSLLILTALLISTYCFSQKSVNYNHQVITIDGNLYLGNIKSYKKKRLYFKQNFKTLKTNELLIEKISDINGDIPKFRIKAILKDNPIINLNNEIQELTLPITDAPDFESIKIRSFSRSFEASITEDPEKMWKKHNRLGWMSLGVCGASIGAAAYCKNKKYSEAAFISGLVSLGGLVMAIHHSFKASHYRDLIEGENVSLGMSEEGIGLALSF